MGQSAGWDGYYDASADDGRSMSGIGDLGDLNCGTTSASCPYVPSSKPVGSGSAYYPGSVDDDAAALNFLGYGAGFPGGGNGQRADMANAEGAWDSTFQDAVKHFQAVNGGLTVDGWIGPATRAALGRAVNAQNAKPRSPNALPIPKPPPGVIPTPPAPGAPIKPGAPSAVADHTKRNLLIGGGVLAAVVGGYFLLK